MKAKNRKILFAAENLGGFQAILPVIKEAQKIFEIKIILAGSSVAEAERQKIDFDTADLVKDIKKYLLEFNPDIVLTSTSRNDNGLSIEKKIISLRQVDVLRLSEEDYNNATPEERAEHDAFVREEQQMKTERQKEKTRLRVQRFRAKRKHI